MSSTGFTATGWLAWIQAPRMLLECQRVIVEWDDVGERPPTPREAPSAQDAHPRRAAEGRTSSMPRQRLCRLREG